MNGETRIVQVGDFVKVPDGAIHALTRCGGQLGRLLCVNSPGAMHDTFFSEAGETIPAGKTEIPAPDGLPDIPAIVKVASRVGMTILAPADVPA